MIFCSSVGLFCAASCALVIGFVCDKHCCTYIIIIYFILLQENIDTVTIEKVENVGEEDCIKIKAEEELRMQLGWTVKSEEQVSVVCLCILW